MKSKGGRLIAAPLEVFYSYAHKDERLRQKLETHLSTLQQQGLILPWHDRNISAGTDWERAIDTHLNSAHLILLLISPDFIASTYCSSIEARHAIERHLAGEARVIPIILRPTDWQGVQFERLQALPTNAKPITTWPNRDQAFLNVAQGIRQAIEELQGKHPGFYGSSPSVSISTHKRLFPSFWNVPYPRNPFFTGREELLTQLTTALKAGPATALSQPQAISGLGGIGKTQTAVEYAYRSQADYQAVLWVRADARDNVISDFVTIAGLLKLPEKGVQDQMIAVNAVKEWLRTHEQWLLILDNADDLAMVRKFMPLVHGGHILLTTRASAMGRLAQRVEVEKLDVDVGALFLLRRAGILAPDASLEQANSGDREAALKVTREMDGLPLALDQAGAYIEETPSSLEGYLRLYRQQRGALLVRRGGLVADHPASVATTWSLSFEEVEKSNPAAADLLRVCAFLHPDAIPEEMLIAGAPHLGPQLGPFETDELDFNEAIRSLYAYSLVRRDLPNMTLSMHRLVQAVLKDAMNEETQRLWAERVVRAVNAAFPKVEFATWQRCQVYLPHTLVCEALIELHQLELPEAASLLDRVAWYLEDHAQYVQAEPLYQRALKIYEKVLSPDHPDTSGTLNNLANLYRTQGRYEEAEPLYQRSLAIKEKVLPPEHPNTAITLDNLAQLYYYQGRYKEAEPLYQRSLAIEEKVLPPEHRDTGITLNNLAQLYYYQGRYEEAEPLYQRALAIKEQVLGPEHPNTAITLDNLAQLYQAQGRYTEAESLCRRALAIREKVLPPDHPDIAATLDNLAQLYRTQSRYEEAEPLYLQALAIREKALGLDHPNTGITLNNLANLNQAQRRYEEAEPLYQRALAVKEKVLPLDHPETANTLGNLALLYYKQERYEEAEPLYQRTLAIVERALPPDHPNIANTLAGLALLYYKQRRYEEAEPLYQRALAIYEKALPPDHSYTSITQKNYASLLRAMNRPLEAQTLEQHAKAIRARRSSKTKS